MAFYPVNKELQTLSRHMPKGNFGLWFNKFIPLNNENACKPSDDKGDENKPAEYYCEQYRKMKNSASDMLKRKHADLDDFCAGFPSDAYAEIVICATLNTPLITGIGESHPHEISMVFDHNMGIPYIPASGVKGIVRFAHTLSLWSEGIPNEWIQTDKKGHECFDDDTYEPVFSIFGNQKNCGRVVFLDAYPEEVPDLRIDIMNPHYAPYYSDGKPPADHYNPTPIRFLTVARDSTFVFRAVAEIKNDLPEKVNAAFEKALTEEGFGAKTAVGYGRFTINAMRREALSEKRKQRQQEEDHRRFPWRVQMARMGEIADWGQFRQMVLENVNLVDYRHKKEVAEAVQVKALELLEKWRKSWDSGRDAQLTAWLESAGVLWQALRLESDKPLEEKSEECKRIEGLRDWGAFKSIAIIPEKLPLDALQLLKQKMEEWDCNSKNAKEVKKMAYKKLKDLLRQQRG